jgi:L-fuculose-phosphate aldolase
VQQLQTAQPERHFLFVQGRWVRVAAEGGKPVKPHLDDLAQIIGPNLPIADPDAPRAVERIRRVLRRRGAVLLKNHGCLCAAGNRADVEAVAMVAEKGCRAAVETALAGKKCGISTPEAVLMRLIYLATYRKKAG